MNTTEAPDLMLPRCCAHLMSWDAGPLTARIPAVAVPVSRSTEGRAPESATAVETNAVGPFATRAVDR
jgi:hypothetical protein